MNTKAITSNSTPKRESRPFRDVLVLAGDFFMKKALSLTRCGAWQAVGKRGDCLRDHRGMALAAYGYVRMTLDVDVLLTPEGLARFREKLVGRGYVADFPAPKNVSRCSYQREDRDHHRRGVSRRRLAQACFVPDPASQTIEEDSVRVINLEKLIELKLASGLSAGNRLRDLADVQD